MKKILLLTIAAFLSIGLSQAKPIKIGFITTLTTPGGYLGRDARDGFMLAVKDGKLGNQEVDVLVEDDQFKPNIGKKIASRMLKKDKVKIFTGVIFSNVATAVVPMITKKGAFYLGSNAAPSSFAGEKCHANYFATAWQNDNLHEAAGALANSLGYTKSALIAPNYPAGRDAATGFIRQFKGQSLTPIFTQLGQSDYAAEIAKIRSSGADTLFVFLPGGMGINFLKQYAQSGMNKKIPIVTSFVNTDAALLKAVGKPMLGIYSASHWSQTQNLMSKDFVTDFMKVYNRIPTTYAAQAYDAANLIASGLVKTKGKIRKNSTTFRKAIKEANFDSIRGKFKFGINNHPIQNWHGRIVSQDENGNIYNKVTKVILRDHQDSYVKNCKL